MNNWFLAKTAMTFKDSEGKETELREVEIALNSSEEAFEHPGDPAKTIYRCILGAKELLQPFSEFKKERGI